ncbi:TRAP transporter small permease [Nitratireductor sp. XY-223]|uniref:TRAP transporter small permease subunit n=1 Tax=Nitratireductor sp. XY-223 TaxID=2561926 RepID=UPI00145AC29B|nr:TRAP transporter small permease [Nitratireductor sp. XY-223]
MSPIRKSGSAAEKLSAVDLRLGAIENLLDLIAGLFIFALMVLGIAQVVCRQVFDTPIFGYIDMVELAMASFAFLGIAYCQRLGGHVRMEMFLAQMKGRPLWLFELFGTAVALVVVSVLVFYGFEHTWRAYQIGDSTIDAELPLWPSKMVVPLAFSVLWLRLWVQFFGFARLALRPAALPVAVPLIESVSEQAAHEIRDAVGVEETRES